MPTLQEIEAEISRRESLGAIQAEMARRGMGVASPISEGNGSASPPPPPNGMQPTRVRSFTKDSSGISASMYDESRRRAGIGDLKYAERIDVPEDQMSAMARRVARRGDPDGLSGVVAHAKNALDIGTSMMQKGLTRYDEKMKRLGEMENAPGPVGIDQKGRYHAERQTMGAMRFLGPGMIEMANQVVNPEAYGTTTGQVAKEFVPSVLRSAKDWVGTDVPSEIKFWMEQNGIQPPEHRGLQDVVYKPENPTLEDIHFFAQHGMWPAEAEAQARYKEDPSTVITTPLIAEGVGSQAVGFARGAFRGGMRLRDAYREATRPRISDAEVMDLANDRALVNPQTRAQEAAQTFANAPLTPVEEAMNGINTTPQAAEGLRARLSAQQQIGDIRAEMQRRGLVRPIPEPKGPAERSAEVFEAEGPTKYETPLEPQTTESVNKKMGVDKPRDHMQELRDMTDEQVKAEADQLNKQAGNPIPEDVYSQYTPQQLRYLLSGGAPEFGAPPPPRAQAKGMQPASLRDRVNASLRQAAEGRVLADGYIDKARIDRGKRRVSTPIAVDGTKLDPNKFYIKTELATYEIPGAKPVVIPGYEKFQFFAHKTYGQWVVSERSTGYRVGDGPSFEKAMDNAEWSLKRGDLANTPEKFGALIEQQRGIRGAIPTPEIEVKKVPDTHGLRKEYPGYQWVSETNPLIQKWLKEWTPEQLTRFRRIMEYAEQSGVKLYVKDKAYSTDLRGTYNPTSEEINVFNKIPAPRGRVKLTVDAESILSSLEHEVGHRFDQMRRMSEGPRRSPEVIKELGRGSFTGTEYEGEAQAITTKARPYITPDQFARGGHYFNRMTEVYADAFRIVTQKGWTALRDIAPKVAADLESGIFRDVDGIKKFFDKYPVAPALVGTLGLYETYKFLTGTPEQKEKVIEDASSTMAMIAPAFVPRLREMIKKGDVNAKHFTKALKIQRAIESEPLFDKFNPDKLWIEDNNEYLKSVDPDLLCQLSKGTDVMVNALKKGLGEKYDSKMAWDAIARAQDKKLPTPCPPCYVYAGRAKSGTAMQKPFIVGVGGYSGDIMRLGAGTVADLTRRTLRHFSSTDWKIEQQPGLIVEFTDMAKRGMPAGAYTRTDGFVEINAPTGAYINMSFGRGENAVADRARAIKYRKKFPNVGTAATEYTDASILELMRDPQVDHILPFHGSGQPIDILKQKIKDLGHSDWNDVRDYTSEQSERLTRPDGRVVNATAKNISDWNKDHPDQPIDPSRVGIKDYEHGGDLKKYLALVEERGLIKKFPSLYDLLGDKEKGLYMKLIGPEYGKFVGYGGEYPYKPVKADFNYKRVAEELADRKKFLSDDLSQYSEIANQMIDEVNRGEYQPITDMRVERGPILPKGAIRKHIKTAAIAGAGVATAMAITQASDDDKEAAAGILLGGAMMRSPKEGGGKTPGEILRAKMAEKGLAKPEKSVAPRIAPTAVAIPPTKVPAPKTLATVHLTGEETKWKPNLDNLNLTPAERMIAEKNVATFRPFVEKTKGKKLSDAEVVQAAHEYGMVRDVISRDAQLKKASEEFNSRKNEAFLASVFNQGTASVAQFAQMMQQFRIVGSFEAEAGRTLQKLKLSADPVMQSTQASVLKKLAMASDEAGNKKFTVQELTAKYDEWVQKGWDFKDPRTVIAFYREFVKPNAREILDEYRYINMLSSPNTHLVNLASNIVQGTALRPGTRLVAGGVDWVGSALTGRDRVMYAGSVAPYAKGFINAIPEAYQGVKDVMAGRRQTLRPDLDNIPTNSKWTKFGIPVTRALEASDVFMRTLVEKAEIEALTYDRKKAGKPIDMEDITAEAQQIAEQVVFRGALDPSNATGQGTVLSKIDAAAGLVMKMRRDIPATGWLVPFVVTPLNIMKQGLEYSPLGFATMYKSGNKGLAFSKAMIGSSVFAGASYLAFNGMTTWKAPALGSKARDEWDKNNFPEYSVRVGDKWVSYSKLGPLAYPIALAAAMKHAFQDNPDALTDGAIEKIGLGLGSMANFFADQSYVQSLGDIIDLGQNVASGEWKSDASQLVTGTGRQLIPLSALQGWVNGMIDPIVRKNVKGFDPEAWVQNLQRNWVGMSTNLEPRLDEQKEPVKKPLPVTNAFSPLRLNPQKPEAEAAYKVNRGKEQADKAITKIMGALKAGKKDEAKALHKAAVSNWSGDFPPLEDIEKRVLDTQLKKSLPKLPTVKKPGGRIEAEGEPEWNSEDEITKLDTKDVPPGLMVEINSYGAKTGKVTKTKMPARQALTDLYADLDLYEKLNEMVA